MMKIIDYKKHVKDYYEGNSDISIKLLGDEHEKWALVRYTTPDGIKMTDVVRVSISDGSVYHEQSTKRQYEKKVIGKWAKHEESFGIDNYINCSNCGEALEDLLGNTCPSCGERIIWE